MMNNNNNDFLLNYFKDAFKNSNRKHSHRCENCGNIFCHTSLEAMADDYSHHCPLCHAGPFTYKLHTESELAAIGEDTVCKVG